MQWKSATLPDAVSPLFRLHTCAPSWARSLETALVPFGKTCCLWDEVRRPANAGVRTVRGITDREILLYAYRYTVRRTRCNVLFPGVRRNSPLQTSVRCPARRLPQTIGPHRGDICTLPATDSLLAWMEQMYAVSRRRMARIDGSACRLRADASLAYARVPYI